MEEMLILSPMLLTTLTIEVVKWVVRAYMKNPELKFQKIFYTTTIPFFSAVWSILLGLMGWTEPVTYDLKGLAQWALAIVVTLVLYNAGIKPFKDYDGTKP